MNKQKELEILNSMEIVDAESGGEAMLHIYVENNEENKNKLLELGFSNEYIESGIYDYEDENNVIDLNHFAWDFAEWFNGKVFLDHNPNDWER